MTESTITISDSATSMVGPRAVEVFRLASLISALKLQAKGIRVTRGRSALAIAKETTGLKSNKYALQIFHLHILLEEARKDCTYTDTRSSS